MFAPMSHPAQPAGAFRLDARFRLHTARARPVRRSARPARGRSDGVRLRSSRREELHAWDAPASPVQRVRGEATGWGGKRVAVFRVTGRIQEIQEI